MWFALCLVGGFGVGYVLGRRWERKRHSDAYIRAVRHH
jgi:hypothetical protein